MKKIIFLTLLKLITLLLILNGCSNEENTNENQLDSTDFNSQILSTETRDKLPNTTSGGISLGLYNNNGEIETETNFNLEENQRIEKFISLGNLIDENRTYKLLLFVDFQQEKFSVDNKEPKYDFTFHMDAGESIEIPFKIDPLKKGLHDILFVIAKYPDNKSINEEFRENTDLNNLLFLRFSTVVDGDEKVYSDIQFNKYGELENNEILDGIFTSKENTFQRWLKQEIPANEDLKYITKIGNNRGEKKSYALINLFDWEQQTIIDNQKVTFFELDNNQLITLQSIISTKNKDKGVYDLAHILIHNPFEKLTLNNREVETGVRVGIEIGD